MPFDQIPTEGYIENIQQPSTSAPQSDSNQSKSIYPVQSLICWTQAEVKHTTDNDLREKVQGEEICQ